MTYEFGTNIETADGAEFHVIANAECDGDAQAEHQARRIGECPEDYDLTDMDGKLLTSLTIRRDDAEWSVSI